MTIERELRRHFNAPPTLDIGNHLRELGRVFLPALIGAIVVAFGTYAAVSSGPAQYQVGVTAKIDSGNVTNMTDVTVNMLAPPYLALSESKAVLDDIVRRSATPMSSEELARNLSVAVETSPALVQLSVTAQSPEDAATLAENAVKALDEAGINVWNDKVKKDLIDLQSSAAATAEQMATLPDPSPARDVLLADYQAQLQRANQLQAAVPTRLGLLSSPGNAVKVAPKPVQQALVAGVVALLVLLEVLALLNGRVGRKTNAAWVRRIAAKRGYAVSPASGGGWPPSTRILMNKVAGWPAEPLVLYPDTSSAAIRFVDDAAGPDVVVHTAASDWWADGATADRPLAVVVVDLKDGSRASLVSAFDALDGYGIPVQLVTITPARRG
ncbi:hypothetical protein V4U86_24295 [Mycobacterium sp. AMU20-3851]|uniref:hypothetical protein n=1 Tax=Mycobacterium sp. AMU20-3851 TaxID=3122055 RepID=UPI003753FB77